MKYLANAFSLQMLPADGALILAAPAVSSEVPQDAMSVIGHPDTANVVSGILGFEVKCNRISVHLEKGDILYVAQYTGPRLPEGATTLPEGAKLSFWKVAIN